MERILFGKTRAGQAVEGFRFANKNGLEVRCISYGCRLTHILLPGANGAKADILLGFDTLGAYEADTTAQGALVGRFAGRIPGAAFDIGPNHYELPKNDGANFLHGSLSHRVFTPQILGDNSVSFTYISPDGEDGFPGEVKLDVTYTLTDQNELVLDTRAVSTAPTHLNLTNHSYFNLAGGGNVLGQEVMLHAGLFLEADAALCPTGRQLEAAGAFDFSRLKPIGRDIHAADPQLKLAGGYDHCFVLDRLSSGRMAMAATARDPASGRSLRAYTTQPGVQFYTGNGLSGQPGKGGLPLEKYGGFCLETQHFPAAPAFPDFPSTLLQKGEPYHHATVLQFGWPSQSGGE